MYWPTLFVLTHIPVMAFARRTGMSDKTMHFLAYMVLMCLVWLAVSPYEKVRWRRARVWLVLAAVVWYGAFDEWLQGRVGRSVDVHDFMADLAGAVAALLILSLLEFWQAAPAVAGIVIVTFSLFSRIGYQASVPWLAVVFHFFGYALFSLAWIQYARRRFAGWGVGWVRWAVAVAVPLALLAAVKTGGLFVQRPPAMVDCATAVGGIVAATGVSWAAEWIAALRRGGKAGQGERSPSV